MNGTMLKDVAKFTNYDSIIITNFVQTVIPNFGVKLSSLPTLALISPNKDFIWYLGNELFSIIEAILVQNHVYI
jgi:hypothetical protein